MCVCRKLNIIIRKKSCVAGRRVSKSTHSQQQLLVAATSNKRDCFNAQLQYRQAAQRHHIRYSVRQNYSLLSGQPKLVVLWPFPGKMAPGFTLIALAVHILLLLAPSALAQQNSPNGHFLARTLGSHMVLQRDVPVALYGYSSFPSSRIQIDSSLFAEPLVATSAAQAEPDPSFTGYFWSIELPAAAASFTKHKFAVTSNHGESASLVDVLFGDVFLCGGQSNMQMSLSGDFQAEKQIPAADDYPYIRLFTVGQDTVSDVPLSDLHSVRQPWAQASSASVNGTDVWAYFSAACWEFGRNVFEQELQGRVPLGLVSSNWGGTPVQAWGPESLKHCEASGSQGDAFGAFRNSDSVSGLADPNPNPNPNPGLAARHSNGDDPSPQNQSVLYFSMILPYRAHKFKGAVWYQGEYNAAQSVTYPCLQDSMVKAWRELWGEGLPFIYTQISTWTAGGGGVLSSFRLAQATITSITPNSAMITAADIGDPESPYNEIHPRNKTEVGRRLALAAATLIYGKSASSNPFEGPKIQLVKVVDRGVALVFSFESCGEGGLRLQSPQLCPPASQAQVGGCGPIELVYDDGSTVLAVVTITSKNEAVLSPSTVVSSGRRPVRINYGLGDYPLMTIYNSLGTPLLPFTMAVL